MIPDLNTFLQRVIEHALVKSPNLSAAVMSQDKNASEAYMVEVLGEWLAAIFETDESNEPHREDDSDMDVSQDFLAHYEELADRNSLLAAALGACDCWGKQANCSICHGTGKPGWTPPDRRLFAHYVLPAINTVNKLKASQSGTGMTFRKKMNGEQR